ncbi:MAG: hypothetical protein LBH97_07815 [Treponema sp.]|nr:hypothetical protein [Treponema sp.]
MDKYINLEDAIFILNMRIRMVRDLILLDAGPELFLDKTLDDLEFIDSILEILTASLIENTSLCDRQGELDKLSDLEWQFNLLLTEFSGDRSPFSAAQFPQIRGKIAVLRSSSATREKNIAETIIPGEQSQMEPVVSSAELNGLLQTF